ncbi:MAG: hypothetical protein IT384_15200 [Deltaproteobacteria bacterium]|nr:hypothetical protein [Deltaproteobacteria bacterium]
MVAVGNKALDVTRPLIAGCLLANAGLGCVDSYHVILPDLPPDVEWVALIAGDDNETAGSGFAHRLDDRFDLLLDREPPPGTAWLLAYRGSSFLEVGAPGEQDIRRAHVRRALLRDPVLPAADYLATGAWRDGELRLTRTATASQPDLTVDWLPACPRLVPAEGAAVATTCLYTSCAMRASQSGCQLEIAADACEIERLSGSIGPRGELALDFTPQLGTCATPIAPASEALASAACLPADCTAHLIRPARSELRAQTAQLVLPAAGSDPQQQPDLGYLAGLALAGDASAPVLAVGSRAGAVMDRRCPRARDDSLLLVDPETLTVTATVQGFECLSNLAPDPLGGGFFATTGVRGRRLARLDSTGAVVQEVDLSGELSAPDTFARRLLVSTSPALVLVLYANEDRVRRDAELRIFDLELGELPPLPGIQGDARALAVDAHAITVGVGIGGIVRYRLATRQVEAAIDLPRQCGHGFHLRVIGEDPLDRDAVFATSRSDDGHSAVFFVSLRDGRCSVASFYESSARLFDAVIWPRDPRFLLASADAPADGRGSVALLDRETHLFLPSALDLGGRGLVAPLEVDRARGRVFALLPHDGKLARVDGRID